MKRLFKILLLAAVVASSAMTASAGRRDRAEGKKMDREELATRQAKRIASELALSDADDARFVDLYVKCRCEVWAQKGDNRKTKYSELTDAQTDSLLRARMDRSQKLLDIRKKYYKEYRKFLSAKQVARVYKLEERMGDRLDKVRKEARKVSKKNMKKRHKQPRAVERNARPAAPAKSSTPAGGI